MRDRGHDDMIATGNIPTLKPDGKRATHDRFDSTVEVQEPCSRRVTRHEEVADDEGRTDLLPCATSQVRANPAGAHAGGTSLLPRKDPASRDCQFV